MCKIGDIILVENYCQDGNNLDRHSFIVLSTENGQIRGMDYNLVCNVMSSFRNEAQKSKKLSYPGNFEIKDSDRNVPSGNSKDGYVKAEQFFYFNKQNLNYHVIGNVTIEFFNTLIEYISELEIDLEHIVDNLQVKAGSETA